MAMTRNQIDQEVAAFCASAEAASRKEQPEQEYIAPAGLAQELANLVDATRKDPLEAPKRIIDFLKYRAFGCTDYDIFRAAEYACDSDGDADEFYPFDAILLRLADGCGSFSCANGPTM